jgi:NACalpha-BTF3-like transcription factor
MNNIYKDQLEILRQRIPVGVRHGLILLEKTDGDLEKAEIQFQEEMITQIIHKTEVTRETATRYLKQNNFDIPRH